MKKKSELTRLSVNVLMGKKQSRKLTTFLRILVNPENALPHTSLTDIHWILKYMIWANK